MAVQLSKVFSSKDVLKIGALFVVSAVCWVWVYVEFQKPVIPPEWQEEVLEVRSQRKAN